MDVACLKGRGNAMELLAQATIAYNDVAMTWNEFLKSRKDSMGLSVLSTLVTVLRRRGTDSSDPGKAPAAVAAGE